MSELYLAQLVIPDCPSSMNWTVARGHWSVAHREKKRWQELFEVELMISKVPKGMVFCAVDVLVEWKKHRRRDVANWYGPITKPLYDALVNGGWLPDDTDQFVTLEGIKFSEPEPEAWPYQDPRLQARMTVSLTASYNHSV